MSQRLLSGDSGDVGSVAVAALAYLLDQVPATLDGGSVGLRLAMEGAGEQRTAKKQAEQDATHGVILPTMKFG